jgi:hypothetical protein
MRGAKRGLVNQRWSDETLETITNFIEIESLDLALKTALLAIVDGEIFDNLVSDDDFFIDKEILKDEGSDKKSKTAEKSILIEGSRQIKNSNV